MRFIIRHQISPLEEEVYEFEITNSIEYKCFWLSKRKSENEPWGYDWSSVYENNIINELEALDEEYPYEVDYHDWSHPKVISREEIYKKYNPTMHGLLSGSCSNSLHKNHPLKISKEFVIEKAIEYLKGLR